MGQHRIQRARANDPHAAASGATYAVYLGFLEDDAYEVKPGFAKLGADAYFDAAGDPVRIVRGGVAYTPNGEQGYERSCSSALVKPSWWKVWTWHWKETCVGPVVGWKNAKMAFRGTLNAVVTLVDHLYGLHLVTANAVVTATVEELGPDHPVRRLLTPFGFRTEAINYQASFALVNEKGLIHRAAPLTVSGLRALFAFARSPSSGITWASIPERRKAQAVDPSLELPLVVDGDGFYNAAKGLVGAYLREYYADGRMNEYPGDGPDRCGADKGLKAWRDRINVIAPMSDIPELTCAALEELLSTVVYLVTAGHTHVGALAGEVEDPCFAPWSWREGEQCGTPRTALTQALTFALTSLEQPLLLDDFSHVLLNDKHDARSIWKKFTDDLAAHGAVVDKNNAAREAAGGRAFRTFDPDVVEVAVGI